MFRYLAENISYFFIKKKLLPISKREIYVYAFEVILLNFSILCAFFGISILENSIDVFIGFLLFFLPLRIMSGGYHARHSSVCFCLSIFTYLLAVKIIQVIGKTDNLLLFTIVYISGIIIVLVLSPVVNKNHPLNDFQYRRNKKILLGIVAINSLIFVIDVIFLNKVFIMQTVFTVLVSILVLIGKVEDIFQKR